MSALPGKVSIEGITELYGEKVFVLTLLQARNPEWVKRPFFAKFSNTATWLNQLRPAFGDDKFFFQDELNELFHSKQGQYFDNKVDDMMLVDASMNSDD